MLGVWFTIRTDLLLSRPSFYSPYTHYLAGPVTLNPHVSELGITTD